MYTFKIGAAFLSILLTTAFHFPDKHSRLVEATDDTEGIFGWSPSWASTFRHNKPPTVLYKAPKRVEVGPFLKRTTEHQQFSDDPRLQRITPYVGNHGSRIYKKWSPEYIGTGGYMYNPNRQRWSLFDNGDSRFLTSFYGGGISNHAGVQNTGVGGNGRIGIDGSVIELAGSNDLSDFLGEEMNVGLGLDDGRIGILDAL